MKTENKTSATSESINEALRLLYLAMKNDQVRPDDAKILCACAEDFLKLETAYSAEPLLVGDRPAAPDHARLCELITSEDFAAATVEGKRIRVEMKPLLKGARERKKSRRRR